MGKHKERRIERFYVWIRYNKGNYMGQHMRTLHSGYFFRFLLSSADFFKINFFKKFFQEHYLCVKQFGPSSGQNFAFWVIFSCFRCRMRIFSKLTFSKNSFRNTIRVSNSLDVRTPALTLA